jgi:hypothetical protein
MLVSRAVEAHHSLFFLLLSEPMRAGADRTDKK